MNQQIKVNRKLHKENIVSEKDKILEKISKITGNQLKAYTVCPMHKVVVRKSVPDFVRKNSSNVSKAFRSQASQTDLGSPNDYEGVVRYPSSRKLEMRPKKEVGLQVEQISPRSLDEYFVRSSRSPVNHIKLNQIPVIKPRLVTPTKKTKKPDPCRAPSTYQRGVIPKYLQKLKEENEEKQKNNCTSGFKSSDKDLLDKEEKLKKLTNWHESYKEMISEFNLLPATS